MNPTIPSTRTPISGRRRWRAAVAATMTAAVVASTLIAQSAWANTMTASDDFERSVSNGWGAATAGGSYIGTFSKDAMTVSSGVGKLALGSGEYASVLLGESTARNVRVSTKLRLDSLSGVGSYTAFILRYQSDNSQYRARIELNSAGYPFLAVSRVNGRTETSLGKVKLSAPMSGSAWYNLTFTVVGSSNVNIRASLSPIDSADATTQLDVTDSSASAITSAGRVGLWSYVNAGAARDLGLSFDDLNFTDGASALAGPATPTPTQTPTSTPTPTTSVPPTTTETPATGSGGSSTQPWANAGSAAVGTTEYPIPSGALFVNASAASGGDGSQGRPYRTVQSAVDAAKSGSTLVLRGGTYHEQVTIPWGKALTVQAYPKEAVWFDGSVPVTAWRQSGNVWIHDNWTARFSTDIEDGQNKRFIDPNYPTAASPDQVFVDGAAQRQVATTSEVTAGTFAVDYTNKQLIVGSNPSGKQVRASDLSQAFNVIAAQTTLQGFGVRYYGTTYGARGTIRMQNVDALIRNLVIEDNAMIGLTVNNNNGVVERVTSQRNGLLGIGFDLDYNMVLRESKVLNNNTEKFKYAPVAGGVKVTRSRGILVERNDFSNNYGSGLWFDQSNYDMKVVNNRANNNATTGIQLEISDTGVVAGNQALGGAIGIHIYDTGNVRIFNNELGANSMFGIKLGQDKRRPTDANAVGLNPRVKGVDPIVTWVTRNITVSNNTIATGAKYSLYARDGESYRAVDTWNVTINGNLFDNKAAGGSPMVAWGRGDNQSFETYNTPESLAAAKNSSWRNALTSGVVTAAQIGPDVTKHAGIAVGIPSDIASLMGVSAGSKILGRP